MGVSRRCVALGIGLMGIATVTFASDEHSSPPGLYARLGDIDMYYEDRGVGEPLLFIHGGFGSSEMWRPYADELSSEFRVLTPDSRGQGRTRDGSGPITYGRMAHDVVALMDQLGIQRTHLIGHSDGGCVILHLLVDFPDRVQSATLIGTPYHTDNYPPEVFAELTELVKALRRGEDDRTGFKAAYERRAPDPSHWLTMVTKLSRTWLSQPTFAKAELNTIERPVLVVKVDHDEFLPAVVFDETAAMIPNAKTHHIPDGTHRVAIDESAVLIEAIRSFVSAAN